MKKLISFVVIALFCLVLVGCGSDSKDDDTTIYHNTFAFEGVSNEIISSNDYHIEAILWVEDSEGELVAQDKVLDSVDALYQSRVDVKAPFIPGYKFMGWYDDNDTLLGGLGDTNIKDGYDFWWNSYQKNGILYAKYQLWSYTVVVGMFEKSGQNAGLNNFNNGYKYDVTKGEVTLAPGATTNGHETFKEWYYVDPTTGKQVVTDKLPTDYFENELVLFARFETEKFMITAEYDQSKGSVEMVDALFTDGSKNPFIDIISETSWKVEYGYSDFYNSFVITPVAGYRGVSVTVDGEFAGNCYVEDGTSSCTFGFRFNQGKDIVVSFEFFE